MTYRPDLLPKVRSDQIMASASGTPCTLRIASFFGQRCDGPETSVMCHLPVGGKGMSTKVTDIAVACGCRTCHQLLDEGGAIQAYPAAVMDRLLRGHVETLSLLLMLGAVVVPDGEMTN